MSQASDIKELRRRLNLTQQQLAVQAGLSVRAVAGYEIGDREPEAASLAVFADLAGRAGHADLCARFTNALLAELKLHRIARGFASFSRDDSAAEIAGHMLVVARGAEQADVAMAFWKAFMDLIGDDAARRERASAALGPLTKAYGVGVQR